MSLVRYPRIGARYGEPEAGEVLGTIQGKQPGSKQEWFVAQGLWHYGWSFDYQVPIRGGRLPGGQVLDFLIYTEPRPTPLQPFSTYFHRGMMGNEDRFKLDVVRQIYGVEPVVWWSDLIDTQAKALAMVLKTFGKGPGL